MRASSFEFMKTLLSDGGRVWESWTPQVWAHFFKQYEMWVQKEERVQDRHDNVDNWFIGLNTAAVTLLGYVWTRDVTVLSRLHVPLEIAVVFGFFMQGVWFWQSHKQYHLLSYVQQIVNAMETILPAAPHRTEWEMMKACGSRHNQKSYPGRVLNRRYLRLAVLKPLLFALLYVALGVWIFSMAV